MERGSDKHGFRMDDGLKAETAGMLRAGRDTRIEEWNSPEPSGEDEPDVDITPHSTLVGGLPPGLEADDVEGRSELASFLGASVWPAPRDLLLAVAAENNAPSRVLELLEGLPADVMYTNVSETWTALGGHVESGRD